jgi:HSP20 family protein
MNSRRTPFDMFNEMERMFDQMRRSMWGGSEFPALEAPAIGSEGEYDSGREFGHDSNLSLDRTDDGYVVLADLPGFEKEEIDLRFDDGRLYISASHDVEGEGYARSRRVSESISVPGDVVIEDVSATYRNGVLEVTVPVDEAGDDAYHIDIE